MKPKKKQRIATDDPIARTKAAYREQAKAGLYDAIPRFKRLCLSENGYDPQPARAILASYDGTEQELAGRLLNATEASTKEFHAPRAPQRNEEAEGDGQIIVQIAPWAGANDSRRDKALSAHYLGQESRRPGGEYLQRAWDGNYSKEDQAILASADNGAEGAPAPPPAPAAEIDRAALIAKLPRPESPQDPAEEPPRMRETREYYERNYTPPPTRVVTGDGEDE